jgi:hypothetical protein
MSTRQKSKKVVTQRFVFGDQVEQIRMGQLAGIHRSAA